MKIQFPYAEQAKIFLTQSEYRNFAEKFYEKVKPEIDKNNEKRIKSIEDAFFHLVD